MSCKSLIYAIKNLKLSKSYYDILLVSRPYMFLNKWLKQKEKDF